ncbi:MAG TPA: aldehyde dehydrogenase (NADP(+)) [Acidobacteriota bacterium]|nr:aldehyde dehydrogenase (NADP(+)) [Acidobacteriota bacterium]
MELHGKNILGREVSHAGHLTYQAFNPSMGKLLDTPFYEATEEEVHRALELAHQAFPYYRRRSAEEIAGFLDRIAEEIAGLGDQLLEIAQAETALPPDRLAGERLRTINQIRMFAALVREGSWLEASIDRGQPDRKPTPKPDVRRMLVPIGPVVVFGASNFPLAFSVAGGDTASALAAGNPVTVKAHPAHPGTSELVARAIAKASGKAGLAAGVFSMVHGRSPETSLMLVRHPLTKAVGFTGSFRAGRALFEAAGRRPDPIPVYAEMGSVNPVFVLPGVLREHCESFAEGLRQSVTLGVGQFCTCPGLVVGLDHGGTGRFVETVGRLFAAARPATMLYPGILRSFEAGVERLSRIPCVSVVRSSLRPDMHKTEAAPTVFFASAETFLNNPGLGEEVFGPSTVIVRCTDREQMERVARGLQGQLTASVHGTTDDLLEFKGLISLLEDKAGRLIYNGFPTGVEICPSMHHGGPYPATTDVRSTSVGSAAIKRFARPVCFQGFPQEALPVELRNLNARKIWRLVDNQWTRDDC